MNLARLGNQTAFDGKSRFVVLSHQLSEMAAAEDLNVVPFYDPNLIYFSALDLQEQRRVLIQLEALVAIGQQIQERGEKIRSVKSLTWAFLKHFQCTAPSDMIGYLNDSDLVNAYGLSHKLLYASFSFFEVFSYSLEDFYCRSWMDLFERDNPVAQDALFTLANDILKGKHEKVTSMSMVPHHRCTEASSPRRTSIWLESQHCAPIYNQGEIIGYLGSHSYKMMSAELSPQLNIALT